MSSGDEDYRDINDSIERMRDPSHERILSKQEIQDLYGNDFEIVLSELKLVLVNLEGWMEFSNTQEDVRNRIRNLMKQDIAEGKKTGFEPYEKNSEICFDHRWCMTIGVKR